MKSGIFPLKNKQMNSTFLDVRAFMPSISNRNNFAAGNLY